MRLGVCQPWHAFRDRILGGLAFPWNGCSSGRGCKLAASVLDSAGAGVCSALAGALGFALGVAFAFASRLAVSLVRPERPHLGLAVVSSLTFARLLLFASMLFVFASVAPAALAPFGICLAAAFLSSTILEGVREVRTASSSMSA